MGGYLSGIFLIGALCGGMESDTAKICVNKIQTCVKGEIAKQKFQEKKRERELKRMQKEYCLGDMKEYLFDLEYIYKGLLERPYYPGQYPPNDRDPFQDARKEVSKITFDLYKIKYGNKESCEEHAKHKFYPLPSIYSKDMMLQKCVDKLYKF